MTVDRGFCFLTRIQTVLWVGGLIKSWQTWSSITRNMARTMLPSHESFPGEPNNRWRTRWKISFTGSENGYSRKTMTRKSSTSYLSKEDACPLNKWRTTPFPSILSRCSRREYTCCSVCRIKTTHRTEIQAYLERVNVTLPLRPTTWNYSQWSNPCCENNPTC